MSDEERADTVKREAELASKNVKKLSEDLAKKMQIPEVTLDDVFDMCIDGRKFITNAIKNIK